MTHAHHDGSPLYVSTPNPALGTEVTLRVRTSPDVRTVTLRTVPDGDPHHLPLTRIGTTPGEVWWTASGPMTNHVLTYRFLVETDTRVAWLTGYAIAVAITRLRRDLQGKAGTGRGLGDDADAGTRCDRRVGVVPRAVASLRTAPAVTS